MVHCPANVVFKQQTNGRLDLVVVSARWDSDKWVETSADYELARCNHNMLTHAPRAHKQHGNLCKQHWVVGDKFNLWSYFMADIPS